MGTIFEELVRRFNEENNEEAGEHWTPRDAVKLMAKLIFLPIADQIESGTYLLYDGSLRHGRHVDRGRGDADRTWPKRTAKQVETHLYGQEINAETYAICKADLLLKGEGEAADNIVGGPEHSTLSNDAFPCHASSTSCSPTRPTARAGRATRSAWAARAASRTRAS
jgi:type I restriction enzyme M protein